DMVVLISMAVAGSILGFLRHNTYPAQLFMGDTGSQFLGFSLGVLVIVLSQSVNSAMSSLIPLFILGLPILDTMAVMGQRLYEKRSPFSPDKNHIHHKLLDIGFDQYEAVFLIYLGQSALIAIAYFMLYELDSLLLGIYALTSAFVLGAFHLARLSQWKFHISAEEKTSLLRSFVTYLRNTGWLTSAPVYLLKIIVPVLFVISAIFVVDVQKDMSVLALVLIIMLLVAVFIRTSRSVLLEKAVIYIAAVLAAYFLSVGEIDEDINNIINILFYLLVFAFVVRLRFSYENTFQVTPLDYLVIILVIIVPNLPEVHLEDSSIGEMAVKLVILFYASEAVMGFKTRNWDIVRMGVLGALSIVVYRGF
ncbi:MAG: MraY family glycosyltransferase, partial [Pseudomonadota bacterium]